ncbi:hypothetical protein KSP40_PGU019619 [Platanthera guangdongensis]|uniref:Plastid lipid-associated protein/fibrillin conserved domain-containing protein n=1 Tax=Platanthera guangdongensis TaxID=2320717 RepID=A0ABR2MZE6_9ASPA
MNLSFFPSSISTAKSHLFSIHTARPISFAKCPSNNSSLLSSFTPATATAAGASAITAASTANVAELENRKHDLLRAVQETERGLSATVEQRSSIEEAVVSVEVFGAGSPVDLVSLDGTWRLNYTSAADVLVLFEAASRFPFFQVGQIFQKFECRDQTDGGLVRNVVRWSVPSILELELISTEYAISTRRVLGRVLRDILGSALRLCLAQLQRLQKQWASDREEEEKARNGPRSPAMEAIEASGSVGEALTRASPLRRERNREIPRSGVEQEGATLLVTAKFSVLSKRNIFLHFEELQWRNAGGFMRSTKRFPGCGIHERNGCENFWDEKTRLDNARGKGMRSEVRSYWSRQLRGRRQCNWARAGCRRRDP